MTGSYGGNTAATGPSHCRVLQNHPDFGNWPVYKKSQYRLFKNRKRRSTRPPDHMRMTRPDPKEVYGDASYKWNLVDV